MISTPTPQGRLAQWLAYSSTTIACDAVAADASTPAQTPWIVFAVVGWTVCILLLIYLVLKQRKWQIAFSNKEWVILPTETGTKLTHELAGLSTVVSGTAQHLANQLEKTKKLVTAVAEHGRATREEFTILRDELELKQNELKLLQLGKEFYFRKPVLLRVVRALEIMDEDLAHQRDAAKTLEGVRIELEECLQDNNVATVLPEIGQNIADLTHFDVASAERRPAPDESRRGTVAEVLRPAYIGIGPAGKTEVLSHARLAVFI